MEAMRRMRSGLKWNRVCRLPRPLGVRAQPHNVLLDGNLFPGHQSPPSLLISDSDSEIPVHINDGGY